MIRWANFSLPSYFFNVPEAKSFKNVFYPCRGSKLTDGLIFRWGNKPIKGDVFMDFYSQ